MRRAVERKEFRVYYQPIISLPTGRMVGFEALIRWQHPERGMLLPDQFIHVMEETGLTIPLREFVLNESCRQLRDWNDRFSRTTPLSVSVNLSSRQFMQLEIIDQIDQVLKKTKLPSECLRLEITETVFLDNSDLASKLFDEFKERGIMFYLDDFGTGYSSLSWLLRFPIKALKIDRSFVSRMNGDLESKEIVETIVALAHKLKMDVIAEGVETEIQLANLRKLKCGYAQGFYFAKAVDPEAAEKLLKENPKW